MTQDDIKKYIVCLNGGSGVIFQPIDENYSYILTAKHVFDDIEESYNGLVNLSYYCANDNSYKSLPEFKLTIKENYFPHSEEGVDIAIIKVERFNNVENIIIKKDIATDSDGYSLYGYPKVRRKPADEAIHTGWIRADLNVTILTTRDFKRREADISKNQTRNELVGSSGGGILRMSGEYLLLAGIQNQMVTGDESLGRVEFTPVEHFNEIVQENQGNLVELLPPYMGSFIFLKDEILKLEGYIGINNVAAIRNQLKLEIDSIQLRPKDIITSSIKNQMLVNNEDESSIASKKLWISWLEYLIILHIIKQKIIDDKDLLEIFNEIRLIHSETKKDWITIMQNIFETDLHGLIPKGVLIVSTNCKPSSNIIEGAEIINNIAQANPVESFKTDNALIHPLKQFTFVHINVFEKECIIDKQIELNAFTGIEIDKLIPKLKDIFDEIL